MLGTKSTYHSIAEQQLHCVKQSDLEVKFNKFQDSCSFIKTTKFLITAIKLYQHLHVYTGIHDL